MNFCVKSKIFTKIIASAMSVMMIFSMSGVSVKAAQLQENNELKTVMVDMKDVATGDAIVYASTSTQQRHCQRIMLLQQGRQVQSLR